MSGGGALMQLMAMGAQDAYIKDADLKLSPFRQVYRKTTNHAVESVRQTTDGQARYGKRMTCTLSRSGDLVTNVVLEIVLKKASSSAFYPSENLVKSVEVQIGGQRIDLLTNTYLRLYDELHRPMDAREAYRVMNDFAGSDPVGTVKRFFLPLPFWFCNPQQPGTWLPMIALQYHSVELIINLEDAANLPGIDTSVQPEVTVWADYAFLDTAERRAWAAGSFEYLIEQTQLHREPITVSSTQNQFNITLPFNHPLKYVAWVLKPTEAAHGTFTSYGSGLVAQEVYGPVAQAGIQCNGVDRFRQRTGAWFRSAHAFATFGQAPSVGVYVYSFGLDPRAWCEPAAALNASRIDSLRLQILTKAATLGSDTVAYTEGETLASAGALKLIEVHARNFNVLRILSGMGGLVFSN